MSTRFLGLLALLGMLFFMACQKTQDTRVDGTIIGVDNALCPCCGGYLIVADGFTYRAFKSDFPTTDILDNPTFPIEIRLTFKNNGNSCNNINRITINTLEQR